MKGAGYGEEVDVYVALVVVVALLIIEGVLLGVEVIGVLELDDGLTGAT